MGLREPAPDIPAGGLVPPVDAGITDADSMKGALPFGKASIRRGPESLPDSYCAAHNFSLTFMLHCTYTLPLDEVPAASKWRGEAWEKQK